jgi:chromosome segregation ATPase
MNVKDMEIVELNKQQIIYMGKYEKAVKEIQTLNEFITINKTNILNLEKKINSQDEELQKLNVALKEKNIALRDQLDKISDQEKQISLLYNDNVKWEEKHKEQLKDNENFKKWANWDNDLIDSFKKIEILNNELAETKKNLDKFSEENKNFREQNQKLTENLEKTKKNEEILRSEVLKLNVNKDKCEQLEAKMKDFINKYFSEEKILGLNNSDYYIYYLYLGFYYY